MVERQQEQQRRDEQQLRRQADERYAAKVAAGLVPDPDEGEGRRSGTEPAYLGEPN